MKYNNSTFDPYFEIRDIIHTQVDFIVYSRIWRDVVIPISQQLDVRHDLNDEVYYIFQKPNL